MATGVVLQTAANANLNVDAANNLQVSAGRPPYMDTSLLGQGWTISTSTLFTPLTAVPTTTAALEIFNGGTRVFVIRDLFAEQILSTAATQTYAIYAMVTTTKAVPSLTALTVFSLNGKATMTPTAASEVVTGVGTTVVANGWRPYGNVQAWGTAAATPGNSWSAFVGGAIIVPPNCSVALHVVGSIATASTFQVGCSFDILAATVAA